MKILLKPYILLPILILILISSLFLVWPLLPTKPIDIVVINKTVPTNIDSSNNKVNIDYRKHKGYFWMLNQQRYVNSITGKFYDFTKDYYGPYLDSNNTTQYKTLDRLSTIPDLIYLTDAYGDGKKADTKSGEIEHNGISLEETAIVSDCHIKGSTIVGEFNIFGSTPDEEAKKELQHIFGVEYTGWSGKYINDMMDSTELPEWLTSLYEKEYGQKWALKGQGIIFVSDKEELVVLQAGIDYNNQMNISFTSQYSAKFSSRAVNYYNWFEVVKAQYGTEILANYSIDATDSGKEKLNKSGISPSFPAIFSNTANNLRSYYFAGDFNDYMNADKYNSFIFADVFNRIFTYDSAGDTSNFYWNFYLPLMKTITKEAYDNSKNVIRTAPKTITSVRINNNKMEINKNNAWNTFDIRGFNINGIMPGSSDYQYTQDIGIYREWITSIGDMGGNCVRAYDLMPPSFYRAIDEYNKLHPDKAIFIFQNISLPNDIKIENYNDATTRDKINKNIEYTVNSIHGIGNVPDAGNRKGGVYINDMSQYLLAYIVETDVSQANISKCDQSNAGYKFNGTYFTSDNNSTPSEAFIASICDGVVSFEQKTYNSQHPIGAVGNQVLVVNTPWVSYSNNTVFDISRISFTNNFTAGYFVSYSLQPSDKVFLENQQPYANYSDENGSFTYGGYINAFKNLQTRYPILIDKFGLPTNMNLQTKANQISGLSEYDQGNGIVRMMKAIRKEGYLGGLVYEYNDNWNRIGESVKPYEIPAERKILWHNALDPEQNYGIMAIESKPITKISFDQHAEGIVDELQMSSDETYLYVTISLKSDINYQKNSMTLGFDTIDRTSGEYSFQKDLLATSWTAMEYTIKFNNKNDADLYVIPNYNVNNMKYFPSSSSQGVYDLVSKLKYGNFDASNNNFYQTGSSIYLRLPWGILNFADPSRKMVIYDSRTFDQIKNDAAGIQTQFTNGIVFSLLVSDNQTKDTLYQYPVNRNSAANRVYPWETWETPSYRMRLKTSYSIINRYFTSIIQGQ